MPPALKVTKDDILRASLALVRGGGLGHTAAIYIDEQKEQEREVVKNFINRNVVIKIGSDTLLNMGKINVITEEEFDARNKTTD